MENRFFEVNNLLGAGRRRSNAYARSASIVERFANSFDAVDYEIPGTIDVLKQPSGLVCWATVATMMISWRDHRSAAIETVIGKIGATYLAKYKANQWLLATEKVPFLNAAGFVFKYPQSLTIAAWEQLMRNHGPIWVTTAEGSDAKFGIHARIITAIKGDGTPEGTKLTIIDPATGTIYPEKFADFLVKFEREVRVSDDWDGRIQIVHWPAGVAAAHSFAAFNTATSFSTLSSGGIDLIKRLEGFRARKYNDQAGHCTIGYGTLIHKGNCNGAASEQPYENGITDQRATELLMDRVTDFERTINQQISVTLNQNQFDALVSFVYNIGSANFSQSTLRRVLNEGNYSAVPAEMRKWVKIRQNGALVTSQGLVNRRNAEIEMWNGGASNAQSGAQSFNGFATAKGLTVQEVAEEILSNPGRVIIPANIRQQLEQIRTNGTYTLNNKTFTPSLSLLQSISQMIYFSLDHNPGANPAFAMLSYIRPASTHHSNGTAVDLTHIDGKRIDIRNQQQCLDAVVAAINNLAPGSYALGLPRPPYPDGAGADHDFNTYNRHITVYANTQPPTLLPAYQDLNTTGNLFLPNRWNEHSPTGSTNGDLGHIANETSRNTLRTAISNAQARGANIRYLFADALDHLHIQAL